MDAVGSQSVEPSSSIVDTHGASAAPHGASAEPLGAATPASERPARAVSAAGGRSRYLVSPAYDWAFFLLPPVVALLAGVAISGSNFSHAPFTIRGVETTGAALFMGVLVHAHLVAVFFRSHGNPAIFRLHPGRFVLAPIAVFVAIVSSTWIAVAAAVVATFWDVWHSGAQTFGFARIYDRNAGFPVAAGRRLDYALNQLLYAGPILAGATLMDHVDSFGEFESVGDLFFAAVPAHVDGHRGAIRWTVIGGGVLFLTYYVFSYVRLARAGHRTSPLKVYLLVSTGLCSIYSWGFNTWGEAFFIMNLFHAVQYLALVWATERKSMIDRLGLGHLAFGASLSLVVFLGSVGAYGATVALIDPSLDTVWALTMVVSLMHFWYDAFIWSVRKQQI